MLKKSLVWKVDDGEYLTPDGCSHATEAAAYYCIAYGAFEQKRGKAHPEDGRVIQRFARWLKWRDAFDIERRLTFTCDGCGRQYGFGEWPVLDMVDDIDWDDGKLKSYCSLRCTPPYPQPTDRVQKIRAYLGMDYTAATRKGKRFRVTSSDGGQTWSPLDGDA